MSIFLLLIIIFLNPAFSDDVAYKEKLSVIEQFLSSMNTLEADITMDIFSEDESTMLEHFEGRLWLERKRGLLRINYGKNFMIAKNGVLFVCEEKQEIQKFDTEDTPAGILLRSFISFKEEKVTVKSFVEIKGIWRLLLMYDSPIGQVPVTLYFKPLPVMILLGWTIQNPDRSITKVYLNPETIHMAINIDQSIFKMK